MLTSVLFVVHLVVVLKDAKSVTSETMSAPLRRAVICYEFLTLYKIEKNRMRGRGPSVSVPYLVVSIVLVCLCLSHLCSFTLLAPPLFFALPKIESKSHF